VDTSEIVQMYLKTAECANWFEYVMGEPLILKLQSSTVPTSLNSKPIRILLGRSLKSGTYAILLVGGKVA